MKTFDATNRDNVEGIMRLQLDGNDMDLIAELVERLKLFEQIEDILNVKAGYSPFILGQDTPTVTKEGRELLEKMVEGWGPPYVEGEVLEVIEDGTDT